MCVTVVAITLTVASSSMKVTCVEGNDGERVYCIIERERLCMMENGGTGIV